MIFKENKGDYSDHLPIGGSRVACRSRRPDGVRVRSRPIRPAGPKRLAERSSPQWPAVHGAARSPAVDSNSVDESPGPCNHRTIKTIESSNKRNARIF